MNMWLQLRISIALLTFFISHLEAQSSCTTPNGEQARCISIYNCNILYDVVSTRDPGQLRFLRESQCHINNGNRRDTYVCCGTADNFVTTTKVPRTTKRPGNRRPIWGSDEDTTSGNRNSNSNDLLPDRTKCGIQDGDRILNGEKTSLTEFPWMALLQYRTKRGRIVSSCGGTLISSRYVLTAAHCVKGAILTQVGTLVNVRLGEYNTDSDPDCIEQAGYEACNDGHTNIEVEKTIPHPNYSDTNVNRYNDIALVRLKENVVSSTFIKPICLPKSNEKSAVGDNLVVAGWGKTEHGTSSSTKLKLSVPVKSASQCANKFRTAGVSLATSQLCAGGELGRDSCKGDSGGPLMSTTKEDSAQWYIEGIVSFGAKCGSEGWPGVYTRVSEFLDWIRNNVK